MAHDYTPVAAPLTVIPCPDDGDARTAASVNAAIEALADAIAGGQGKIDRVTTDGATWTVPSTVTYVDVTMRAPGGGGGGGARGNSTDTADSATMGGAGGGAGELLRARFEVTPGDVLTWAKGTAGIAGVGSATVDGGTGGDATDSTLTSLADGLLLTSRGGHGGGGGIRNIDTGQVGGSIGGRSTGRPSGTLTRTLDDTTATVIESLGALAYALSFLGPGAGTSLTHYVLTTRTFFPCPDGSVATEGADGADDTGKLGGKGGGGGGNTEVPGGTGGAGGAAVSGGSGVAGSAGSSPAADTGCGGGGGGSGGCGTAGGVGANGAAGVTGWIEFSYFGPQAVIA